MPTEAWTRKAAEAIVADEEALAAFDTGLLDVPEPVVRAVGLIRPQHGRDYSGDAHLIRGDE